MKKPIFEEEAYDYFRHPGDPRPTRQTLNGRWGGVSRLVTAGPTPSPNVKPNPSATFVFVPTTNVPRPVAFLIRFSLDGVTWHATNPSSTASVTFRFTSQIDLKAGEIIDQFELSQGQGQPFSQLITTGLNLTAVMTSSDEMNPDALYVAVTACPVCCVDGTTSPGAVPADVQITQARAWSAAAEQYFDSTSMGVISPNFGEIPANADRSALYICNKSTLSQLMISLAGDAQYPPVAPDNGAFILPPGGVWEMPPGYTGRVTFTLDTGSVGLITWGEGSYS